MKSLNDNYQSTHGSAHETFADLMFCALVVLVLFVLALAIEVSQRVRAEMVEIPKPEEVRPEELSEMTKEEVAELSRALVQQREEMQQLQEKLKAAAELTTREKQRVESKLAALNGEQRFTGAREPAALNMAYNYSTDTYIFLPSRQTDHATTQQSGESVIEHATRRTKEFVAIALNARKQRGFTKAEAKAIYQAFTGYREVIADFDSYQIEQSSVGIHYIKALSGYIAGDTTLSDRQSRIVELSLLEVYTEKGPASDKMYPSLQVQVDEQAKTLTVNGVVLQPRDLKEILNSLSGRGAMIDLEGLSGPAPEWIREEVLIPAGYISKTPKLPD